MVRLRQGDFDQAKAYSDDPVAVAATFAAVGARWLHIVDLDGARDGRPRQSAVIESILGAVGADVQCEVGGGLRTDESIRAALAAGARRIVLGTAALQDPALAARLVRRHGAERIVAAIDVRDGRALGDAWRADAQGPPLSDAIDRLVGIGIRVFETTAIERDGVLAGPDLDLLGSVVALGADVIASGGIRSVADLHAVRAAGCTGAIVGRALYDGSLRLSEALAAVR